MQLHESSDPEEWARTNAARGYRAAAFPCDIFAAEDTIRGFARSAARWGIQIAEVGGWGNVLRDSDRATRKASLDRACRSLWVADEIGAGCAVNIAGSRGSQWDGPDEENLTPATYALIVDSVREIIDAVRPSRSFYTLEPMPWMYPCDIQSHRALLRDVDRPAFAVHFDPVNMIRTLELYYSNSTFISEFVREFGPLIKAVHAKDTLLAGTLTLHLQEVPPGRGRLDYRVLLSELEKVSRDMPMLIEHLSSDKEYEESALHLRGVAQSAGITL
jgi:sugar phosphate isomerase/epimerase